MIRLVTLRTAPTEAPPSAWCHTPRTVCNFWDSEWSGCKLGHSPLMVPTDIGPCPRRPKSCIDGATEQQKKLQAFAELEAAIQTCQAHGDTEVSLGWLTNILERNR